MFLPDTFRLDLSLSATCVLIQRVRGPWGSASAPNLQPSNFQPSNQRTFL